MVTHRATLCTTAIVLILGGSHLFSSESMADITVEIQVWSSLSYLFGGQRLRRLDFQVNVPEHTTLDALMDKLAADHPQFGEFYYKPGTREPNGRVSIVVNEQLPELLNGYETPLEDGYQVVLVQAYEGG